MMKKDLLELFEREIVFGQLYSRLGIDHKVVDFCFRNIAYVKQQVNASPTDEKQDELKHLFARGMIIYREE